MNTIKNPRYLYDSGLPFSKELAENIDTQLERIDNKRASLIIIDGAIGSGKTTLGTHMMDYTNKKVNQRPVSLKIKYHPQLALGGKEFITAFRICHTKKFKVLTYDEAGDFSRRGSISFFNSMLNRLFETYRGFRMMIIVCLPNFCVLDNQLFDNQIPRFVIHIEKRTATSGTYKGYSLSQANWIRYWYSKLPTGARTKCYSKVSPTFHGHFLNLPPAREKELDKLSTYGKTELLKSVEINMQNVICTTEIARKLNRSIVWVYKTLIELKANPKSIIKKVKYYDKNIVDVLIEHIQNKQRERKEK